MDLFPTYRVPGCHILDKRLVADFVTDVCQFDRTLSMRERKNVRLFLNHYRGKLFWEYCLTGHYCRRAIKGYCICVCLAETDGIPVALEKLVQMFRIQADLMESHRQRLSFVCYFDKHGANVLDEI